MSDIGYNGGIQANIRCTSVVITQVLVTNTRTTEAYWDRD